MDVIINGKYRLDNLFELPVLMPSRALEEANACLNELFSADSYCKTMIGCFKLIELLLKISTPKKLFSTPVAEAVEFIEKNYGKPLDVSAIAEATGTSSSNLFLLFRKEVGVPPMQYLSNYRLTLAAKMITQTQRTISEIAYSVGIEDVFYFSKKFKQKFLLSPLNYRLKLQESNQ